MVSGLNLAALLSRRARKQQRVTNIDSRLPARASLPLATTGPRMCSVLLQPVFATLRKHFLAVLLVAWVKAFRLVAIAHSD